MGKKRRIVVYLGHPAHFHLYKHVIRDLEQRGNEVNVLIKKKDVLESLLDNGGYNYKNILKDGRKDSKWGILWGTLKRTGRLAGYCVVHRPNLLTGTSVENSWIGKLLGIPVVNVNEDDAAVVPLYAKLSYPMASEILNPVVCNSGKWDDKAVKYNSYHELAYLHPNHFTAEREVVERYFTTDTPYFILRFAKLNAHHDSGINGINDAIAQQLIDKLLPHGRVFITSERRLSSSLEPYRIAINPLDMHHVMAFADIYIGDSQTMAAEAGVLGVPFIRFNDFVGRIGYLKELEEKYQLGYGIPTKDVPLLYATLDALLSMPNRREVFGKRREEMLSDKIDFAAFLGWFLDNYPESKAIMRADNTYQYRFK